MTKVNTDNYFEREYGDPNYIDKFCRTGINGPNEVWRLDLPNYVENGQSFLDVGCGTGADWEQLQNADKKVKYKGIDYAPSILEGAKKMCPGAEFAVGDVNDLQEKDNSWDVVNCRHVINHTEYYEKPLKELLRVAKKRVILTLHVPFSLKDMDEIREYPPYSWENAYDRGKFVKFLEGLDVKIVTFEERHKGGNETFIVFDK